MLRVKIAALVRLGWGVYRVCYEVFPVSEGRRSWRVPCICVVVVCERERGCLHTL